MEESSRENRPLRPVQLAPADGDHMAAPTSTLSRKLLYAPLGPAACRTDRSPDLRALLDRNLVTEPDATVARQMNGEAAPARRAGRAVILGDAFPRRKYAALPAAPSPVRATKAVLLERAQPAAYLGGEGGALSRASRHSTKTYWGPRLCIDL